MEPNNNPAPNPSGGIIQPEGSPPAPQMPAPDQSAGQQPPAGKGKKLALIILAVLALLLLAGGAYYLYFRDSDEPEAPQQSQQQESESSEEVTQFSCEEGFTEFQGDNIGLHFCYPVSWGDASLEDGGETAHTERGSVKKIVFSKDNSVFAGLVSKDWLHNDAGHGGGGPMGNTTFAQFADAKNHLKKEYIYKDSVDRLAYISACMEYCALPSGDPGMLLSYGVIIPDNPTYELVVFYQYGQAFGADFMQDPDAEKPSFSYDKVQAADLTKLFPKTDSRFTVLQQVADSVRN